MIRAYFDPNDVINWRFAGQKVLSMAMIQKADLPYFSAVDYCNLVRINIITQKYGVSYAAYGERYQTWKGIHGVGVGKSSFWQLFGDLLKNIAPTKWGNGWLGGVIPGSVDAGGKSWFGSGDKGIPTDITMYGRFGEFGRRGQPARAVFTPTGIQYATDPRGWENQGKVSLKKMGQNWS